ncbi:scavenger receptor cysteine-rich type 1 protein M130-like isoform X2 [Betta splendens]|uniref:Scavenger receptor cysteine-rich type 1 protein M130-like isoform X2 n=1 Tax=Betta splendens TaxID=158456 RepID=A0A9W2Y017_BETSP|nr:scavenger receptor cysteine-rich type 1 protein M130-like isoform X2 [Betta splendens]
MGHLLLLLLLLLWSSGAQAEGKHMPTESVRLVGGDSRCAGILELKHKGDWKHVLGFEWTLKKAAFVCRELDCGSALSTRQIHESPGIPVLRIKFDCLQSGFTLEKCIRGFYSASSSLYLTCSDSVRLLNGTGLCSGRLEVRSNQSSQWWSSVCKADFDLQDAEVVCRELGCGARSALQGALYGEVEDPVWSKEFQCGGNESALLDCRISDSARTTCSPDKAVGLTCSEPDEFRLVGGDRRCAGRLELKHEEDWRPVDPSDWTLKEAAVVCRKLGCGAAVYLELKREYLGRLAWLIECVQSGSALKECAESSYTSLPSSKLTCSDSVRLLNGTGLCSGRLEVRSNQSNQWWSSVCEADFDLQDAEVVCRELGCGAPSALQGALYGEVEDPVWSKEFQCGGNESALLDCRISDSARTTCSPDKAVGLTCSEPHEIKLVEGGSRCAGRLELKHEEDWRPLFGSDWTLKEAALVCKELDCGSAVSIKKERKQFSKPVWKISSDCVQSGLLLKGCIQSTYSTSTWNLICSDLLLQPIIAVSSVDGVSKAYEQGLLLMGRVLRGFSFTISCSIQPQYPGGSFQLNFISSFFNAEHNYTQPAVNHSAYFLFPVAEPAHQINYTCVYQVYVFSHTFSSESHPLSVSVSDPPVFPLRVVFQPVTLLLLSAALYFCCKARGQTSNRQEDTELVNYPLGVGAVEREGDVQGDHLLSSGIIS